MQPLLGVAPSLLAFLGLGLQVFPRVCTVYSYGVLVDFLQNLQFQQFVVGLATLFGVAPSIPAFFGFGWVCMFSTVFGSLLGDPAFSVSGVLW